MASEAPLSILVLYSHPLLGEGIGRMLEAEPGALVEYVGADEADAADRSLAGHPDVVVVERGSSSLSAMQVLDRAPDALVIAIGLGPGPTWIYRRQEIPGDPGAILKLVRLLRGGHPPIALAPSSAAEPALVHTTG